MKVQRYSFLVGLLVVIFTLVSCGKGPDISNIPSIEFTGMSKDTIKQSLVTDDSFILYVHIEDGDGDIGDSSAANGFNFFITDSRTGLDYDQPYLIPMVPEGLSKNGVIIDLELRLFPPCCIYPDNTFPCEISDQFPLDSLQLEINLMDRAGNLSNTVTSDYLYLRCNEE